MSQGFTGVVGLDLGRTGVRIALGRRQGMPECLPCHELPSCPPAVAVDGQGHLQFHARALALVDRDPGAGEANVLDLLAPAPALFGNRLVDPQELVTSLLKSVRTELRVAPNSTALCVPAERSEGWRGLYREAASQAGWPDVRTVGSETAIAHAWLRDREDGDGDAGARPKAMVVVDVGAQLTRIAVLDVDKGTVTPQRTSFAPDCGSEAIDEAILAVLAEGRPEALDDPLIAGACRRRIRRGKEILATESMVNLNLPWPIGSYLLSRVTFDEAVKPVVERLADEVERAVGDVLRSDPDIPLVLAGGAAGITRLRREFEHRLDRQPEPAMPAPTEAAACGATLSRPRDRRPQIRAPRLPATSPAAPSAPREQDYEELRAALATFRRYPGIAVAPDIPDRKARRVCSRAAMDPDERLVAVIDLTFWRRSGRSHLAVTDRAIRGRTSEGPRMCSHAGLGALTRIEVRRQHLLLDGSPVFDVFRAPVSDEVLVDFVRAVRDALSRSASG